MMSFTSLSVLKALVCVRCKVAALLKACRAQSAAGRGRCKELREYMARCQRVSCITHWLVHARNEASKAASTCGKAIRETTFLCAS